VQTDITDRKRAEEALRESEERFRGIFEHAGTGIVIADLQGRFKSCNLSLSTMLGYTQEELLQLSIPDLQHPDDRGMNLDKVWRLVRGTISSFEILSRLIDKDGKSVWVYKYVSLLRDSAGKPTNILALVTDMTEHKRQEDHIRLLMREVNHRSKNLLSVVQAIARQTATGNPTDFNARFEERLASLAACHDLLVKNEWRGAHFQDLVRSQLDHFEDLIGTRITLQGPPLFVGASAAQSIGMALHELATNAGKYGALMSGEGRVDIKWGLEQTKTGPEAFTIHWQEQAVHPITAPATRGFGSTVICDMAELTLDAKVEVVEDEAVVALEISRVLAREGSEVVGPARAVDQALQLINEIGCDAAVLDIKRANQTLRNLRWFEVVQTRGHIENDAVHHYQVMLKVGFTTEEPDD
jgi:PAS domain S-box-containing protein